MTAKRYALPAFAQGTLVTCNCEMCRFRRYGWSYMRLAGKYGCDPRTIGKRLKEHDKRGRT